MVSKRTCRILTYLIAVLIGLFFLTACESGFPNALTTPTPEGADVEPVLREFHRAMGGASLLGRAISPLIQKGDAQCQYTQKVLICYNPLLPKTDQYYFYPLGLELQTPDAPMPVSDSGRQRVVNGYVIANEFVAQYDRMFGERYVGRPISQVHRRDDGRIVQYFENMGFTTRLGDPNKVVELIDLGSAGCGLGCPGESKLLGIHEIPEPFHDQIERMGGKPVFGGPLTAPLYKADGTIEQVYERAVFSAPGGDLSRFHLEQIPLILGTAFDLPTEKIYDDRYVFYAIEGGLGYNVPVVFDRFIAAHGSWEASGRPISEPFLLPGQQIIRQCFENLCLDYDSSQPQDMRTRLASLGQNYLQLTGLEPYSPKQFVFSPDTVLMQVSETSPRVATGESQEITLLVLQNSEQRPLPNVNAALLLFLPDGNTASFAMPPTGGDGVTRVVIPPQPAIPNGTVVQYQVCLKVQSDTPLCASETYLVWNSN